MGSLGGETARKKAMWLYPKVLGSHPSERWGHSACSSHGVVYVFGVYMFHFLHSFWPIFLHIILNISPSS
jgi:hypothetical protein